MRNFFWLTLLVAVIISPKLNIISLYYRYGIRLSDVILLFSFFYFLISSIKENYKIYSFAIAFIIFFSYAIIHGIISSYYYGVLSLIIPFRWIEYYLIFCILFFIKSEKATVEKVILAYFFISAFVAVLQHNWIIYVIESSHIGFARGHRPTGLTGGYFEFSVITNLILTYILFYYRCSILVKILSASVAFGCIYMSGSKVGAVLFASLLLGWVLIESRSIVLAFSLGASALGLIFSFTRVGRGFQFGESLLRESSVVARLNWWEPYLDVWDVSDLMLGRGVGSFGLYTDSVYLKIGYEMGLVGLVLAAFLFASMFKRAWWMGFSVAVSSIGLDYFTSSKIMFITLLLVWLLNYDRQHGTT